MATIEVMVTEALPLEPQVFLAAQALLNGEVIIFPTETVYGVAADAINDQAIDNLVSIKHRPSDKAFPVMVKDFAMAQMYADMRGAEAIAKDYWPGPLTLVVPSKSILCDACMQNGTVALRCPSNPVAQAILTLVNAPLAVPSANESGLPPATNSMEVRRLFPYRDIAFRIIQSKPTQGTPTTILKIEPKTWTILRKGPVSVETIKRYLPSGVELKEV